MSNTKLRIVLQACLAASCFVVVLVGCKGEEPAPTTSTSVVQPSPKVDPNAAGGQPAPAAPTMQGTQPGGPPIGPDGGPP